MRVIITGGSGLIGRALTEDLTGDGHEVIVLSRSPERVQGLPDGARAVGWDAKSAAGWGELADGADAIVNLAGEPISTDNPLTMRWTPQRKQRIYQSRVDAGRAVVEAVEAASDKPAVVIQSSGMDYYGTRGDEELTEDSTPGDSFLANVCEDWEASTAAVEEMGVRRAITRGALVLSREGGALPLIALPFKLFVGGPVGSGEQYLSWIHLADVVGVIRFLLDNQSTHGAYNMTAPQPVTNREFSRALGDAMGRPSAMPVPGFVLEMALGEVSTLVLEGQRGLPARLEDAGYAFVYPDIDAALHELYR